MVANLLGTHKALGSIPATDNKTKTKHHNKIYKGRGYGSEVELLSSTRGRRFDPNTTGHF